MNETLQIILISSVRPDSTSAGGIVLQRHLCNRPGLEWKLLGGSVHAPFAAGIARLQKTRFHRWAGDYWTVAKGRWLDAGLPPPAPADVRPVVLTVAHGDNWQAASRYAKLHRLPLVTIFHDWWPDIPSTHNLLRHSLEKRFRALYQSSTVALCVSDGMRSALGEHSNSSVLYPLPSEISCARPIQDRSGRLGKHPFRILYSGNLFDYGPMLREALEALKDHPTIRLEVRGANPDWPPEFREEMRKRGLWFDYAERSELDSWLASGDAFLIPMTFDPGKRRRMETSFPSKLVEFAQLQKPLVIWGPGYCSAVQWAKHNDRAYCVTAAESGGLRTALETLSGSPGERTRLAHSAAEAASIDFNPNSIQSQFLDAIQSSCRLQAEGNAKAQKNSSDF